MAIAFNVEPYWDDFEAAGADGLSPKEKYNKVLFRPGKAVQARELTQLQSTLQNQISSTGDHLFKEGSSVAGELHVHNECDYLKITTTTTDITDFIGVTLTDGTNTAKVLHAVAIDGSDPVTLYVKYLSGAKYTAASTVTGTGIVVSDITEVGHGCIATIANGVYYLRKNFVSVKAKTIIVSKYTTNSTIDLGLLITESLVSSGSDTTLNDNATGTPNESAPGAHRYKISAVFSTRASNSTASDFVLLVRLNDGRIVEDNRPTEYSKIGDTLARRTFDESGNYTVRPFLASFEAHASDATKFVTVVEPAKAYVHGYEIEKVSATAVTVNKARSSELVTDRVVQVESNNYIDVSTMVSYPDTLTLEKINIKNESAAVVGTLRCRAVEGLTATTQRLHVFDYVTTTAHTIDTTNDDYTLAGTTGSFTATIIDANLGDDTAVFALPQSRVKTCNSQTDGTTDFNYQFSSNRNMGAPTSALSSGSVTFSGATSNETIVAASTANLQQWILINNATNARVTIAVGDIAVTNPGSGASTIVITGLGAIANATSLTLFAPTTRTLDHKSKNKTTGNTLVTFNGPTDYKQWQRLNHCDCIEITSVLDVDGNEIKDNIEFDTGQTGSYYGHGKWRVKSTSNYALSANITVYYTHFTHTAGDFFTIDSYDLANDIDYEDIPSFDGIELRSAVDFRPRMGDDQIVDTFNVATEPNASVGVCPTPNTQFQTDVQFYLHRRDLIYIDKTGFIGVVYGVSSLNPLLPEPPKGAMVLYHLYVPAYTLTPSEVQISYIDNKRYTMRDIGKIEKRVQNLEYYTTLSLLETEANALQVLNPTTGTLRFKAGFLVDSFKSTNIGRTNSIEYKAGIDPKSGSLRPLFSEGNSKLLYDTYTSGGTANSTTQKTNSLVTLPYTHTPLITQKQSSDEINVNPYSVFNWTGRMEMDPNSDEWKDIDRRPQVVLNNDSVYNALLDVLEASTATGTVWGSWTTNWTGESSNTEHTYDQWGRVTSDITTTTKTGTKDRTGIKTSIETGTVIENQGDRQVSLAFRPYIRSRVIHFKATLMKPNTTVNAYFGGVRVDDYCRAYNAGDTDPIPLVGPNTVTAHPNTATALVTDAAGTVAGTFFIPNNSTVNFVSGQKQFVLCDSTTVTDLTTVTTSAFGTYYAKGQLEQLENVIMSTRTPTVKVESVTDTQNITDSTTNTNSFDLPAYSPPASSVGSSNSQTNSNPIYNDLTNNTVPPPTVWTLFPGPHSPVETATVFNYHPPTQSITTPGNPHNLNCSIWSDPLAQSFEVTMTGGAFATALDLYVTNKDANIPLNVEIRTMNQGHPTQTIVPFSEVSILPAAITADGTTVTQFVFPDPVYLKQGVEYCFVVWANSDNYKIRYAKQGNEDTNGDIIMKQPYAGVMFKSQNASTWTPDQGSDIMFELHRAKFTIDAYKAATLFNEESPSRNLQTNPFLTTAGSAGASQTITVTHLNHGMSAADTVTIAGAATFNGVAVGEINKTHTIVTATRNTYTIATTTVAAVTAGVGGGSAVAATQYIGYNILHPSIEQLTFPGTALYWSLKETEEGGSMSTTYKDIVANTDYAPLTPMTIKSGATHSMILVGTMISTMNNLSPVIDISRCSVIGISNIIDNNTTVAETDKSSGSALAKYVTKTVQLDSESNILKVFLDTNRPQATAIDVYYKVGSDAGGFDDNAYVKMTPTAETGSDVPYSDDPNIYKEVEYSHDFSGDTPATQFTMFAIKIVFTSTTTAKVPSVRNLRAIALV